MAVHTIYVPAGWSAEQVWETIKRGEKVLAPPVPRPGRGCWMNVDDDGKILGGEA